MIGAVQADPPISATGGWNIEAAAATRATNLLDVRDASSVAIPIDSRASIECHRLSIGTVSAVWLNAVLLQPHACSAG
ncbi:hypothetical protein K227x_08330 [Rubripirellula lacrimiformis]|uniref:Uncharacterized protein n=1 Tax=Rubripirellula lacrimiformis TaxID=1930273 RepID=A0A517N5P2_9BACT|nr:hypothetical protein [Rubripirellula lacrimiformis]QDT02456.1 hypothetical protein K227x_08330 [Rubripirellula lacrimiformis]